LSQHEEALGYYEQALSIFREIGDRAGKGASLHNIGSIYGSLGQHEEALGYYEQALSIQSEIGDRAGEGRSLHNIGSIHSDLGQHKEALRYYEQAVSVAEAMRGEMRVEEFKSSFAAGRGRVYDGIVTLLVIMDRPQDAFGYAQRAKARTLLDQLGNARVSPVTADDPALAQQEEQLRGEIRALEQQLREEWAKPQAQRSDDVIQSLDARLETRRAEYGQLLHRLKLRHPEYASLLTVDPVTLTDTQQILTDTTLIEYYVTGDQTLVFIVTQDDFYSVSISVTQESFIENLIGFYLFPTLEGVPHPMQELYQTLIAPVESYIQTDLVVIAPHNVLHYVPFGALQNASKRSPSR
jgi:tetratricopeptide (TPR) repeat protein